MKSYIERIKAIQPILNCVTENRFEEALKEAKQCDEMLKSSTAPSIEKLAKEKPFFGVPFTTKVMCYTFKINNHYLTTYFLRNFKL